MAASFTAAGLDEVNLLTVGHHAHNMGTMIAVQLFRDDTNMGLVRTEKAYDYQHQGGKQAEVAKLKKTDNLLMHCSYDTSSATEPVNFGELTTDEMCLATLTYYPALPGLVAVGMQETNAGNLRTLCMDSHVAETSPLWAFGLGSKPACQRQGSNSSAPGPNMSMPSSTSTSPSGPNMSMASSTSTSPSMPDTTTVSDLTDAAPGRGYIALPVVFLAFVLRTILS
eukprot:477558-Amphidinium_carterae.1